jgi:imidazolonepropionase-like amidohydrolase/Tol biopolymer transport system component
MTSRLARSIFCALAWALSGAIATAGTIEFTTTQATDAEVTVSPDGKQLVLTILGHLFLLPAEGGSAEQLTFGPCYDNDPAFSPDGREIAFISDRDTSGGNVFLLELATKKLTKLTDEFRAGQPTWSPDGSAILYVAFLPPEANPRPRSFFGGPVLCELRKVARGGKGTPETLRGPGLLRSIFYLSAERPAWTIMEQDSAPRRFFPRATTHIEVLDPHASKPTRLQSVQGDLGRVVASADGDALYYRDPEVRRLPLRDGDTKAVSTVSGGPGGSSQARFAVTADGKTAFISGRGQLFKVALDRGERQAVAFRAHVKLDVAAPARPVWARPEIGGAAQVRAILNPQIAPDGRSLVFMAGGYIWQETLDDRPAQRLLDGDAWECEPALSPDGQRLAFVQTRHGKRELRVLDLDSRRARTLVALADGSSARYPAWSSDGKRLVFQQSESLQSPLRLIAASLNGGALETLATAAADWSARPHFAGPGDLFYFTSRLADQGTVYRIPLKDKREPRAVAKLARHVNEARVSPDGRWLAFRRNTEIWVAPASSETIKEEHVRRLSPEGGATFSFAPDSSAVIYSVGGRVWRQSLTGGERREIPVRLAWRSPMPPPLLLKRVRVLDFATGQFGAETSLLAEQGAIRWIGSERGREIPGGAVVLDGAGRYAIPGLFDFHVHSAWANHDADAAVFLAYGITSVRDTGGGLERLSALADRGDTSSDPVPRYFYSGEIFEGAQPLWGDAFLQIYNSDDARSHVRRWKERGAHFVKVYSSLPWPLQRAAAEEAQRQDLPVAGHGLGLEEIVKSVTLGYLTLEHCPMILNDDLLRLLTAAGTRCDPTLAVLGGHANLLRREPIRLDDPKLRTFFPESFIRAARGGGLPGMGAGWQGRLAVLQAAHRGGIKLHAGTDSLMTGTFFGASLHWELEHLAEAGLKPLALLRMATQEAAVAVGADSHLGTLAPGKLADIVLLDADPLDNIRNTQAIWRVVKGGWLFDPKALR